MERLTKRGTDGQAMMDCEKCKADWTGKPGKPMADCTALYCRNRLKDRLAAYEDTGLTPEEINDLASVREIPPEAEYAINKHADSIIERLDKLLAQTDDDVRLRELAEADNDGHVVIRPYRLGAEVYVLLEDCAVVYPETDGWYIGKETIGAIAPDGFYLGDPADDCFAPDSEIGKTVFLTHEEAEKALEGMPNE